MNKILNRILECVKEFNKFNQYPSVREIYRSASNTPSVVESIDEIYSALKFLKKEGCIESLKLGNVNILRFKYLKDIESNI